MPKQDGQRCITASSRQYRLALAVSMGGMLELYDFLIYALMASYIAENFFPAGDAMTSLLGTFAAFAVGYLSRPLGGLVFGHLGDRYGRKRTFTLTIFLMALTTALMGCLPTYSSIGISAPVMLVLLRLCQGFSLGGELPGAITYLSESVPRNEGVVVGILFMALMVGISLGTFVHGAMTLVLDQQTMTEWGWRVPFWLGGLLGMVSYQIRRRFDESGLFLALNQVRQRSRIPLLVLFRDYRRGLLCGFLMMALCGATVTVYGVYMPSYLSTLLGFSRSDVAWHTALAFLMLSPLCLLAGVLCDQVNRKLLLGFMVLMVFCLSIPAFRYFVSEAAEIHLILLICSLFAALASGLLPPMLINCFPTEIRYTGIATAYNFGFALFGGLAPFISTLLVKLTGTVSGPAIYLMLVAVISVPALLLRWPEHHLVENSKESNASSS
ncbi:MAG: MFS transporter [Endozoicomonas sp.]